MSGSFAALRMTAKTENEIDSKNKEAKLRVRTKKRKDDDLDASE